MKTIHVQTSAPNEWVDITRELSEFVRASGVKNGVVTVFVPHTTAGITINENADPDVRKDMLRALDALVPSIDYTHCEGNSPAHLKTLLTGQSGNIIVADGVLVLGTWQGVYLTEYDGPRLRKVILSITRQ